MELLRIAPAKRNKFFDSEIAPLFLAVEAASEVFITLASEKRIELEDFRSKASVPTNNHALLSEALKSISDDLHTSLSRGRIQRINAWSTAGSLKGQELFSSDLFVILSAEQQNAIVAYCDAIIAFFGGNQSYNHQLRAIADSLQTTYLEFQDGVGIENLLIEVDEYILESKRFELLSKIRWETVSKAHAELKLLVRS